MSSPDDHAERLARLETKQESHDLLFGALTDGVNSLVAEISKLKRNLLIAAGILFASGGDPEKTADLLSKLLA